MSRFDEDILYQKTQSLDFPTKWQSRGHGIHGYPHLEFSACCRKDFVTEDFYVKIIMEHVVGTLDLLPRQGIYDRHDFDGPAEPFLQFRDFQSLFRLNN